MENFQNQLNCVFVNTIALLPEGMQNKNGILTNPTAIVPQIIFGRCIKTECKFWDESGECKIVLAMDKIIDKPKQEAFVPRPK